MKKTLPLLLITFVSLSGCATRNLSYETEVVLSFDSTRIAYEQVGEGEKTLIFVHGWSCDGRYWKNQKSQFAKDYQVITVDLAGHGHSSLERSDYSVLSFAKDIKAVIEKEDIQEAILIGHSMGGGVIAEAARLMPDKVVGIIGVDTFQNVAEPVPQSVIDEMTRPFETDFSEAAQDFVLTMFPDGSNPTLVNWVKEDMSSAPKEIALSAFRHYLGQFVSGEAAQVFEDVSVPVVSINARLWPTSLEENRKYIKDYKLLYIEESGHFPMLERPEAFNSLLEDALKYIDTMSTEKT